MHTLKRSMFLAMLLLTAAVPSGQASAADRAAFAPEIKVGQTNLVLRGTGLLRYKLIFKVYRAALYVEEQALKSDPLTNVAKRIEVLYLVEAKAQDFIDAGNRTLKNAYDADTLASIQERLNALNSWYPDPKPGDRCAITYLPNEGLELNFNGKALGTIPGEDFARIYFSIWLGAKPADDHLRKGLLGRKH